LRTWHYGGGTNAAGDTIAAGGFDPILRLYNDTPTLIAENDDYNSPTVRDSQIDWTTSGMPTQLPADNYQLNLVAYNNSLGGRTGNWAVDLVADAAKFTLTGVNNIGAGAMTIDSLTIGSDDVRLPAKVQVGPLTSMSISGPFIVGDSGGGAAFVSGSLNSRLGYVGYDPGSLGSITIQSGGNWVAEWADIGFAGEGNLRVESGGSVHFNGDYLFESLYLGELGSSHGHLTVTGANASVTANNDLYVGMYGVGSVRVEDSGQLVTGHVGPYGDTIGHSLGSSGTVEIDGKDSLWSTDKLIAGNAGQGIVRVMNGGKLDTTGSAYIARTFSAASSSVTVSGMSPQLTKATWDVSSNLFIAGDEVGPSSAPFSKLTIMPGGLVDVAGTTTVWNGGGMLELLGGEMETGSLIVKPGATFTHTDGTLTIDGGTFDLGTGSGIYAITGADITDRPKVVLASGAQGVLGGLVRIGHDNYGELAIEGGAVLNAASDVAVARADSAPASGKLTVVGTGSRLVVTAPVSSSLAIGANGPGELFVTAGGQVQVTQGSVSLACCSDVGGIGSGQITVEGENSRLDAGFLNFRAVGGNSSVTIRNQGHVRATAVNVISQIWPSSSHMVQVEVVDANSLLRVDGDVLWVLGDDGGGTASLGIRNGGSAHAAGAVWLDGYRDTGVVSVNVDGDATGSAAFTIGSGLYVGGNAAQPTSGVAKLTVGHNGSVSASTVKVWQPGTVEVSAGTISTGSMELAGGTLVGNGTVTVGSQVTNAGMVSPGLSAGVLAINGNYVQETVGTLAIEIGGTAPTQFDRLLVGGSATLHGTLQISLIDPLGGSNVYEPQSGDSFKFLTAAGGLDLATFDNYIWPVLPGGLRLGALYDYDDASVSLKMVGVLGDYNLNDVVDAADYVLWRETYRGPNVLPPSLAADGDGDGDVDNNDWNVWRAHFGQIAPPIVSAVGSVAEVVPEPAETLMAISTVGLLVTFTRLRRFKVV
jgi:T5SS/PEP-CTERM-associated repeat protein